MGFLVTETQRQTVLDGGIDSVPETIMAVLSTNHARVLDWFRSMDSNFDGVISKGEFSFALHSLGLDFAAKDVERVYQTLDPDNNGAVEFEELRRALLDKERWKRAPPPPKKLTRAQLARQKHEGKVQRAELREDLYLFETRQGLTEDHDIWHEPPPNAAESLAREKYALLLQETLERRRNNGGKEPLPASICYRMDRTWIKPPVERPDHSMARAANAEMVAKRKEEEYDMWLQHHRKEIESHALAVEAARVRDKQMRVARTQAARQVRMDAFHKKKEASRIAALDRHDVRRRRITALTPRTHHPAPAHTHAFDSLLPNPRPRTIARRTGLRESA